MNTESTNLGDSAVDSALEENFAQLLEEAYRDNDGLEGTVVSGKIVAIENDLAVVDVGLKSEGRIPIKEFLNPFFVI